MSRGRWYNPLAVFDGFDRKNMAKKKGQSKGKDAAKGPKPKVRNRRAFRDFDISEKVECGIELRGTEVKSLRAAQAKIDEAHARIEGGQLFLVDANIAPYPQATEEMQHAPTRKRRLLIHRRQIRQLELHIREKGRTLIPLAIYFKRGLAKVEIGLAEGKRKFDKRDALKKRQQQRDIQREMRRRR